MAFACAGPPSSKIDYGVWWWLGKRMIPSTKPAVTYSHRIRFRSFVPIREVNQRSTVASRSFRAHHLAARSHLTGYGMPALGFHAFAAPPSGIEVRASLEPRSDAASDSKRGVRTIKTAI